MLGPEDRNSFLKKLKFKKLDALLKAAIFKRVTEICKRTSACPYCGFANGVVKKMTGGFFKIVHEKHRAKNADEHLELQVMQMSEITAMYPDLKPVVQKATVSPFSGSFHHFGGNFEFDIYLFLLFL